GTVCVVGKMRDLILQLSKSSIYSTKPVFPSDCQNYHWLEVKKLWPSIFVARYPIRTRLSFGDFILLSPFWFWLRLSIRI
ncbi:hypothetical protein DMR29_24660, partial [Klebsiella variicola]